MDLNIELKESKIVVSWLNLGADYYKLFCKKGDVFYECSKVVGDTQVSISLLPFGENECFLQAFKDGKLIAESSKRKFVMDTIDVVCASDVMYSECEGADGYRLYKSQNGEGFSGCKNCGKTQMKIDVEEDTEYKIKPYLNDENGRTFLASSPVFRCDENRFESVTIYKTYNYNLFLSWNFQGYADGFAVYAENSLYPVCEINNPHAHFLTLTDFKGSTKFVVKAFVNTLYGKVIVGESSPVGLSIRKFEKPLVSLIIPAYNAQDYIARSIDSALASDFANLEIIIVNDGSTDDTQKIIDWYDKNFENIVSIQKENGGVADTRNVGIEAAKGDYIAFMDNDDLIRPDMISKLYNSIVKNECDVAIAPLYRISDKGYSIHCDLPFAEDMPIDIDKYLEIMYTPGYYNCAIWNKLYKASMVKAHPLGKLKYEDVSWTPCILSYAEKFCFLKSPFYEWDRKTRPETFGDILAKQPEDELFEHRKQAMLFFVKNGNPQKREYMKTIAKRRLARYSKNSTNTNYQTLIEEIDVGKY